MSKKAHVAHHIPGRMRIIIQAGRGNPALLDQTRSLLAEIPGIEKVVVKPDSGSILLHYDYEQAEAFEATLRRIIPAPTPPEAKTPLENRELPGNEFDVMTRELEAEAELIAARSHTAQVIVDFFKDFDHQVKRATNNAIRCGSRLSYSRSITFSRPIRRIPRPTRRRGRRAWEAPWRRPNGHAL